MSEEIPDFSEDVEIISVKGVVKEENIPRELKETNQWVIWFEKERRGKIAKLPAAPWKTGHWKQVDGTDPENWTTFNEVLEYAKKKEGYGIGFSFSEDGPYVGIDFDNCVDEDGNIENWIGELVEKANSYTELSPSRNGLHIIVKGSLPNGSIQNEKADVEAYEKNRFFTVTGRSLE